MDLTMTYGSPLEANPFHPSVLMAAKMNAETTLTDAIDTMITLNEQLTNPVVLGGGAVRDALLQRPIKDYDMFTTGDILTFGDLFAIELELGLTAGAITAMQSYDDCETPFGREVQAIYQWVHPLTGIEVQLILLRGEYGTLRSFADRFDLGLCQCVVTPTEWYVSESFKSDVASRAMTFLKDHADQDEIDRTSRRYARLHNKYPQYRLVLPTGIV